MESRGMKCLIARLLVLLVLLIPASTLFSPPDASAQTTWKLKEITYADINKKLDPNEAVGRGPDFIKWTPSASSFPPPETLRLGDTVSLSFEAAYQYGAGQGGAGATYQVQFLDVDDANPGFNSGPFLLCGLLLLFLLFHRVRC